MSVNTTLTKQSLEELKQKARAATKGPFWRQHRTGHEGIMITDVMAGDQHSVSSYAIAQHLTVSNGAFFSLTSPDVILDLIARVEGLSEALEFYSEKSLYQNRRSHPENCSTDLEWDSGYRAESAIERFGVK